MLAYCSNASIFIDFGSSSCFMFDLFKFLSNKIQFYVSN